MLFLLLLGISRFPKILLYIIVGYQFGISTTTDTFFVAYSVYLFIVATFSVVSELFIPSKKTLYLGLLISTGAVLTLLPLLPNTLVLSFVPLLFFTLNSSYLVGRHNHTDNYTLVSLSSVFYLIAGAFILGFNIDTFPVILSILASAEIFRTIILYVTQIPVKQIIPKYTWSSAFILITAVALGGSVEVIDKAFASLLAPGSITILSYSIGIIGISANFIVYPITVGYLNTKVNSFYKVLIGLLMLFIISEILLFIYSKLVSNWTVDLVPFIMLAGIWAPFMISSAWLRIKLIQTKNFKPVLYASGLFLISNIIFNYSLLWMGVYGLITSTIISQLLNLIALIYFQRGISINENFSNRIRQIRTATGLFV